MNAISFSYWDINLETGESELSRWAKISDTLGHVGVCAQMMLVSVLLHNNREWKYISLITFNLPAIIQQTRDLATSSRSHSLKETVYETFISELKILFAETTRLLERFVENAFSFPTLNSSVVSNIVVLIQKLLSVVINAEHEVELNEKSK